MISIKPCSPLERVTWMRLGSRTTKKGTVGRTDDRQHVMLANAGSLRLPSRPRAARVERGGNRAHVGVAGALARFLQGQPKVDPAVKDAKKVLMDHTDGFGRGPWDIYNVPKDVLNAMDVLIEDGKTKGTYEGTESAWNGTWRLLYAPHLVVLSTLFLSKIDVSYDFQKGSSIQANVKYRSPVFQKGWLNSSGGIGLPQPKKAMVSFDKFWVDVGEMDKPMSGENLNPAINFLGKILFFETIATFPVLYLDKDICIFRFPPLFSNLCARRSNRW